MPVLLTDKVGARLSVPRPYTQPPVEDDAVDVGPATFSSIAIKKVRNMCEIQKTNEKGRKKINDYIGVATA